MKRFIALLVAAAFLVIGVFANTVPVKGYTKKDGTKVAPHHRTAPNDTKNDNWSTKGNVNPYTGKEGTKPRYGEPRVTKKPAVRPAVSAPSQRSHAELLATVARCNQLLDSYTRAPFGKAPFNAERYEQIRNDRDTAQAELNAGH